MVSFLGQTWNYGRHSPRFSRHVWQDLWQRQFVHLFLSFDWVWQLLWNVPCAILSFLHSLPNFRIVHMQKSIPAEELYFALGKSKGFFWTFQNRQDYTAVVVGQQSIDDCKLATNETPAHWSVHLTNAHWDCVLFWYPAQAAASTPAERVSNGNGKLLTNTSFNCLGGIFFRLISRLLQSTSHSQGSVL